MTVNRTTLLDLPLPVTGTESGAWGDITNNGLTQYLDIAIAGTLVLNTDADVTLTSTEGDSSATNIGATTAQYAILRWTATGSTTRNITALAQSKTYVVINATGGTQSIVLRGAGPTTGVTIISGEKALCVWNGSDFVKVSSSAAAGGSNTQVQYNSSGVLAGVSGATTNGTAITFSTTNLKLQGSSTGVSSFASANSSATDYTVTFPAASTTIPIATQTLTFSGPTAARTITLPDANFTAARTDAAQTFTGTQTFSSDPVLSGGTANGVLYLNGSKVATSGSALTFNGTGLGIGVASAGRLLDIQNDQNAASQARIRNDNNGTASQSSWSVSYGDFAQYLSIAQYSPSFTTSNLRVANSAGLFTSGNTNGLRIYTIDSAPVLFGVFDTEAMRLTSTGLGIGTSSPGAKLDVNGEVRALFSSGFTLYNAGSQISKLYYNGGLILDRAAGTNLYFTLNGSNQATLDPSGNLGLGVTPSAWSQGRAFEVFQAGYGVWNGTASAYLLANTYYNSGFKYAASSVEASHYYQYQGAHVWSTAPSGTAGNAITFTQAMTLDANGRLLVGNTVAQSYGGQAPISELYQASIGNTDADGGTQALYSTSAFGVDKGSATVFGFKYNTAGNYVTASRIRGAKENATDGNYAGYLAFDTRANGGNFTERARIDSSGNLLVGSSPVAPVVGAGRYISLYNTSHATISIQSVDGGNDRNSTLELLSSGNGGSTADIVYGDTDTTPVTPSPLRFLGRHSGVTTERARITSGGDLLVGTTTSQDPLTVNGGATLNGGLDFSTSGTKNWQVVGNATDFYIGDQTLTRYAQLQGITTFTAWTFVSDRRIKHQIKDLHYGLDALMQIRPREFNFIKDDQFSIGFIAQELKEVIPEAVTGNEIEFADNDSPEERASKTMGVSKEMLIPVLVKAIQEQQALITSLTARVALLEGN